MLHHKKRKKKADKSLWIGGIDSFMEEMPERWESERWGEQTPFGINCARIWASQGPRRSSCCSVWVGVAALNVADKPAHCRRYLLFCLHQNSLLFW